jgi:hypothetical protein
MSKFKVGDRVRIIDSSSTKYICTNKIWSRSDNVGCARCKLWRNVEFVVKNVIMGVGGDKVMPDNPSLRACEASFWVRDLELVRDWREI